MSEYNSKDILHVKKGNVEYLQFKRLLEYSDKIKHAFPLRHGGVSEDVYASLNFNRKAKFDTIENVNKNLEIFCDAIDIDKNDIVKCLQTHSDIIRNIDENNKNDFVFSKSSNEIADGLVTNTKNIALMSTCADCNTIIFYDTVKNVVSLVHSGWKGTVSRIYLNAIKEMREKYNSKYEDILVCLTPAILQCCFKSKDEEFKKKFTDVWVEEEEYIKYFEDGYFHINLLYVISKDLVKEGIKKENIVTSNICTCCNSDDFFSYRKVTIESKKDYGVMAVLAELK